MYEKECEQKQRRGNWLENKVKWKDTQKSVNAAFFIQSSALAILLCLPSMLTGPSIASIWKYDTNQQEVMDPLKDG